MKWRLALSAPRDRDIQRVSSFIEQKFISSLEQVEQVPCYLSSLPALRKEIRKKKLLRLQSRARN